MNILYLNPDRGIPVLGDKGASVHVREFIAALAHAGHETTLVCATEGKGNAPPPAHLITLAPEISDGQLDAERVVAGLPDAVLQERTVRRELTRLAYDRLFHERVLEALQATGFRPDLIYERYALFHTSGAELAGTLDIPRLLEVNAPLIQEQERFRGLALKSLATAAEQKSFRGADSILAVSAEVAAYIGTTGVSPSVIHTVPNGVDTARFRPDAGRAEIRAKHDLGSSPVIGFIGSFKPWHGVGFLVDNFATVAQMHPDVRLLCVGEGPDLLSARQCIAAHGLAHRAVFTGRVPHAEIPAYLAAMDVSAAPYLPDSDFYFSPLKVVESLAAGTPVVAARMGQLEQLVDHGQTGFLFRPGDGAEFVARTMEMLRNPARRAVMSARARARAEAEFGWDRVVERATNEARRLIATKRAA